MTKVKFCGIKRIEDIEICNELHPDYVGFVFYVKSKRYVDQIDAKSLKEKLDKRIMTVGVFVNENIDTIAKIANDKTIDLIQLHGDEDKEYIKHLRDKTKVPIIKAFKISSENDIIEANKSVADYVLLDSGAGTGVTFNWELIKGINRDYFLAGGLDADNVGMAIKMLNPFAVDVSSGIETDGVKDKSKMELFIKQKEINNDK